MGKRFGGQGYPFPGPSTDGGVATTVEVDLGSGLTSGRFTITDTSITPARKVLCWQAPGPYTGKGTRADEAAMQPVSVVAVEPGAGSATVYWETPALVSMRRVHEGSRFGTAGNPLDNQRWPDGFVPTRLGRARGNVKFSYMVLA